MIETTFNRFDTFVSQEDHKAGKASFSTRLPGDYDGTSLKVHYTHSGSRRLLDAAEFGAVVNPNGKYMVTPKFDIYKGDTFDFELVFDAVQPLSLAANGLIPSAALEKALDRIVIQLQKLNESYSISVGPGLSGDGSKADPLTISLDGEIKINNPVFTTVGYALLEVEGLTVNIGCNNIADTETGWSSIFCYGYWEFINKIVINQACVLDVQGTLKIGARTIDNEYLQNLEDRLLNIENRLNNQ
jgi:hypothetical protein